MIRRSPTLSEKQGEDDNNVFDSDPKLSSKFSYHQNSLVLVDPSLHQSRLSNFRRDQSLSVHSVNEDRKYQPCFSPLAVSAAVPTTASSFDGSFVSVGTATSAKVNGTRSLKSKHKSLDSDTIIL